MLLAAQFLGKSKSLVFELGEPVPDLRASEVALSYSKPVDFSEAGKIQSRFDFAPFATH